MKTVRTWLVVLLVSCQPAIDPAYPSRSTANDSTTRSSPPHVSGKLEDRRVEFQFEGGQLELELYRDGTRIEQIARNRYAVLVVIHWTMRAFDNVEPMSPVEGTVLLPAASGPLGAGEAVVIAELQQIDPAVRYRRELYFHARFGDPQAHPAPYVYALPYPLTPRGPAGVVRHRPEPSLRARSACTR